MCSTKKFTWGAKKNLHPGYPNLLYKPPDCCRCAWKEGRIKKVSEKGNKGNGRTKRKYCYKESVSSTFYFKYLNSLLRHYIQTCAELKKSLSFSLYPLSNPFIQILPQIQISLECCSSEKGSTGITRYA